jgi:hypothetical protein
MGSRVGRDMYIGSYYMIAVPFRDILTLYTVSGCTVSGYTVSDYTVSDSQGNAAFSGKEQEEDEEVVQGGARPPVSVKAD